MKLLQGNCLELMKDIPDKSVDCIITDPPYGINKGKVIGDEDFNIIKNMLPECFRVLKDDSFFICFCSISKIPDLLKICPFSYRWMCMMFTNNSMARGSMGFSAFVPALIFMKGKAKIKKQIRDVCEISTSSKQVKSFYHPYQKHDRFLQDLIKTSTKEGDIVFDPFMGGGSTGVSAKTLGRDFIGMELDESYFKIAKERIESTTAFTGFKKCNCWEGYICDNCKNSHKTSNKNQEKISEDNGYTSPSPPLRKKRQPAEVGYSGDSLASSDTPQDCSSVDTRTAKEDNGDCTLPADSKYNKEWDSYYDEEKDVWLEESCQYKDCEFCSNRPTKPSECKTSTRKVEG